MQQSRLIRTFVTALALAFVAMLGAAPLAAADTCRDQREAAEAPVLDQWSADKQAQSAPKVAAETAYLQAKAPAVVAIAEANLVYETSAKTADDRRQKNAAIAAAKATYKPQYDAWRQASAEYHAWWKPQYAAYKLKMAQIKLTYEQCRANAT